MRAIDPAGPGGPEVLELVDRPVPAPRDSQLLIRVAAAGVNRPDVLQRLGKYPMPPGAPTIPGLEVSGEVVLAQPSVERWRVGDRVTALLPGGGYAEYAVADEQCCLPWPADLSAAEAAGLPETFFTVWANVFERGALRAGERILVHGGSSGIGVTAIQLAKAFGAEVLVTAGNPDKCAAARALGADHAIDYRASDFEAEVQRITGGEGVEVVLDMIGGDYVPRNLRCLSRFGRHLSIATQRGRTTELDLGLVMARELRLTGGLLRPQPVAVKGRIARALEREVWPLIANGSVRAVVDSIYPLAEAADAHRRMEAGEHVGKIILVAAK